jgi:hypothetical protein
VGLDILIATNNPEAIHTADYFDEKNGYFSQHSLSRAFCNLISRKHVTGGEPELDQIGRITNTDISPIYDMEKYWDDANAEEQLSFAETDEERAAMRRHIKKCNDSLAGNIAKVLTVVSLLTERLSHIEDLDKQLDDSGESALNYTHYFTGFNIDKGDGYIGNNFGQDMRNFKRFLEYAKSKGTETVYFSYG